MIYVFDWDIKFKFYGSQQFHIHILSILNTFVKNYFEKGHEMSALAAAIYWWENPSYVETA